jgi:dCMP deaminase
MQRPTWDQYFLSFLPIISARATCDRGRSACLLARNNVILATGYVGSASGEPHCDEVGHLMVKQFNDDGSVSEHCIRTLHCEQNALMQAARLGISVDLATAYISMEPCPVCTKLLIMAGIKRVVCLKKYHSAAISRELLAKANIELVVINNEEAQYS